LNSFAKPVSTPPDDPGFAVYVHWPFCKAKCPYCDFNSHVRHGQIDEEKFRAAYLSELDHMKELTGEREVVSIFFGGGTPSLMPPNTVSAILERIAGNWTVLPDAEITLEANPTSVEAKRFKGFKAAGVNRVSLGVQSLNDADLKALGRLHTADEALKALRIAKDNFDRVSFDLIYARPRQTLDEWRDELSSALEFEAGHMSLYQLTIEEGTPFAALHKAGKLICPDEGLASDLYEMTQELCAEAGLPAYEISNHAREGQECRHNIVYWKGGEYAGIGPGAHGRLDIDGARHALSCLYSPEDWAGQVETHGSGIDQHERLSANNISQEYLLMAMRLTEGMDLERYAALGGHINYQSVAMLETDGMVRVEDTRIAATAEGRLVLNSLIAELAG